MFIQPKLTSLFGTEFKKQFPIFIKFPKLAYLDNAATPQRPQAVIDAISDFYAFENSNIHRGVYKLSNEATQKFEATRKTVADFIGSSNPNSIAFTKGTTESINVVSSGYLSEKLNEGDNVVVTLMEHHANFIPWQQLCKAKKCEFRIVLVTSKGDLDLDHFEKLVDDKTKMVGITHISNTLGTVNPINEIIAIAHKKGAPVMVDAAQSAAYYDLNVEENDIDFLAFSGHKLFGPFGIGVLYANKKYHNQINPYTLGGGIIKSVQEQETKFSDYPHHLDAGTPNVAGVVGLKSAIEFAAKIDKKAAKEYLSELTTYGRQKLESIEGISLLGNPKKASGILSFTIENIHPHDIASFANQDEIALRAGMHCTQPLLQSFGLQGTARASFSLYNTKEEIDRLAKSLTSLIAFWN